MVGHCVASKEAMPKIIKKWKKLTELALLNYRSFFFSKTEFSAYTTSNIWQRFQNLRFWKWIFCLFCWFYALFLSLLRYDIVKPMLIARKEKYACQLEKTKWVLWVDLKILFWLPIIFRKHDHRVDDQIIFNVINWFRLFFK